MNIPCDLNICILLETGDIHRLQKSKKTGSCTKVHRIVDMAIQDELITNKNLNGTTEGNN